MPKRTKGANEAHNKKTTQHKFSTDSYKQIWIFDSIDRDGHFSFQLERDDIDCKILLTKVVEYSQRTWQEIKSETHDNGRSCHHFLSYDGLSKDAKVRIMNLQIDEKVDSIFSMRLNNKIRIIGIRENEKFIVKWYDPQHEFFPIE